MIEFDNSLEPTTLQAALFALQSGRPAHVTNTVLTQRPCANIASPVLVPAAVDEPIPITFETCSSNDNVPAGNGDAMVAWLPVDAFGQISAVSLNRPHPRFCKAATSQLSV